MAIINEIDWSEVIEPVIKMRDLFILTALITLAIIIVVVFFIAHSISKPLIHSIADISSSSAQIDSTMSQQSAVNQSLTSSITEITSTINELEATAKKNTEHSENVINEFKQGKLLAEQGNEKIAQTLEDLNNIKEEMSSINEQIEQLNEQTSEISKIIYMVLDLADQTRMLSLNAAVEALRSGEHGVGFNIVAKEIRLLSDESKSSARKIGQLLKNIQHSSQITVKSTSKGVKSMKNSVDIANEVSQTFNTMADTYINTVDNLEQIIINIKQETDSIQQINSVMNNVQHGQSENSNSFQQIKENISSLGKVAERLRKMT